MNLFRLSFKSMAAKGLFLLAGSLPAIAAHAALPALPDLDAVVSYETRQVTSSGVTRVESWQERMIRREGVVWTERLLPHAAKGHQHEKSAAAAPQGTHKHLDVDTAARWVQQDPAGKLDLRFVDKSDKVVVSIPKSEFGTVGFDGRWDNAAYIVPPELVAKMKPAGTGPEGTVWRTESVQDWSHRVMWSDARKVAFRVESTRSDGRFTKTVALKLLKVTPKEELPWKQLTSFEQKKYDDYMD